MDDVEVEVDTNELVDRCGRWWCSAAEDRLWCSDVGCGCCFCLCD